MSYKLPEGFSLDWELCVDGCTPDTRERIKVFPLTYSVFEVLVSDQFEVLFYGFGGQSVLSEDKVFPVDESVHLTHGHV